MRSSKKMTQLLIDYSIHILFFLNQQKLQSNKYKKIQNNLELSTK